MSENAAPPPETKPRSRWRWVRRVFATLGILLLLIIAFHRPLIGWAAAHFGKKAAADAGLTADWKLSGNYYSGIQIDDLKVTGDELAQIRSISLKHLSANYDLWELGKRGVGAVPKELVVDQLDVEMDMTRPGRPAKSAAKPKASGSSKLPNIFIPKVTISHVNVHIVQPDSTLAVEDFSLTLDPAAPGIIEWKKLAVPGVPEFGVVKGTTKVTPQSLELGNLALTASTLVEKVYADISKLPDEIAPVKLAVNQGASHVSVEGTASAWTTSPVADATLKVTNLGDADLRFWSVPLGPVYWRVPSLTLVANGPVLKPAELKFDLDLSAMPVEAPGVIVDTASLKASSVNGALTISSITGTVQGNSLQASGKASLPPEWADIADAPTELDFTIAGNNLAAFTDQVKGAVQAKGSVKFDNMEFKGANLAATSNQLNVSGIPIQFVDVLAKTAGQNVTLEKALVKLTDQNIIQATGKLGLEGDQPWEAAWQIDCQNLADIPTEVRGDVMWPESGTVRSTGTASGSIANLKNKEWKSLSAQANVDAAAVTLKQASVQSLALRAKLQGGLATVDELNAKFDAQNFIAATGEANIAKSELPLTAKAEINLPEVAKLSAWSEMFGAPKLEAGRALITWDATGQIQPLLLNGAGDVDVTGLKISTIPEIIAAKLSITQADKNIDVKSLAASVGPWRADGTAQFDGNRLTVPELKGWLKDQQLVELSASAPLKYKEEPLELKLNIDKLDSGKLATALGQKFPASGILSAKADFKGSLSQLQGQLDATVSQIKVDAKEAASLEPGNVKLNIALDKGKLTANSTVTQKPLQPMTLKAAAPLDIPALMEQPGLAQNLPITAELHLPSSSLTFLPKFVPALHEINGTAGADITLSGTVNAPKLKGSVNANVPEAVFTAGNFPSLKDVNLKISANDRKVTIDNASLLLSGGNLKVTGGADLTSLTDPALNIRAIAEEILLVRDDTISLRANANIGCNGKLSQALVKGNIDLVRGRVFKEVEFLPLSLPNQLPPPPPSTTLTKEGPPALPAPLDKWDFDINIKTRDPVRLLGNVAHGGAAADLKLAGKGAKPELTGKVKLDEAWLKLPFSRLNLTQAEILFFKDAPFDPQVQMLGESVVGNYMVTLNVTGRALDPKLRFTSSPPLPEGDIAALLATGTTTSDLAAGNGGEAAGRAIFLLVKTTYRKLFPKLADTLDEQQPPRLTLELSGFGSEPNSRGVAAVYEINPKVKAIGRVGEAGTFRGLLYYLIRFR